MIALSCVVLGVSITVSRWKALSTDYRQRALFHSEAEKIQGKIETIWTNSLKNPEPLYLHLHGEDSRRQLEEAIRSREHHASLKEKYLRASTHPWESIEPDPEEPAGKLDSFERVIHP